MKTFQCDYDNVPGIASMYAIPVTDYINVTKDQFGKDKLNLTTTENVVMLPILKNETFSFTETCEISDAGMTFTPEISGVTPKIQLANVPLLDQLTYGDWLLYFQDSNGSCYLAGSVDVPLRFTYKSKTTSANGIKFSFSSVQSERTKLLNTSSLSF